MRPRRAVQAGALLQRRTKGKTPSVLGRLLFSIAKGKRKTLKVILASKQARRLAKSKKGTATDALIAARDRGSSLWETKTSVRLRRR